MRRRQREISGAGAASTGAPALGARRFAARRRLADVAVALVLLAGIALLSYPSLAAWRAADDRHEGVLAYREASRETTSEDQRAQTDLARAYNEGLAAATPSDPFSDGADALWEAGSGALAADYPRILDVYDGIMGYLSIPSIGVELPVRHGTSERTLRIGAGHLPQTSLPVGGDGTHCVISAHTGLPEAKLFDDLDKVVEGDVFYIGVYGETLAYEVDRISVVEPSDTAQLARVEGEDHVTLVTCTPYGINSHRLLVRGTRVPYEAEGAVVHQAYANPFPWWTLLLLAGWVAAVAALWRTGRGRIG